MQQENRERQVEASNGSSYLVIALNTQSRRSKHRANGRNIVGQQLPTLLHVTRCVRLYTLLHVVGCCSVLFETGQAFSYVQCTNGLKPPPTMLGVVGQQCCIRLQRFRFNPHGRIDGMGGKIFRVPSIPLTLLPFIFNFLIFYYFCHTR